MFFGAEEHVGISLPRFVERLKKEHGGVGVLRPRLHLTIATCLRLGDEHKHDHEKLRPHHDGPYSTRFCWSRPARRALLQGFTLRYCNRTTGCYTENTKMPRLLPYVACLLAYVMTPMSVEATESLMHLLVDGHTAHSVADDAHQPDEAEHGCSGSFHMCPCHSSVAFMALPQPLAIEVVFVRVDAGFGGVTEALPADGYLETVFRPPIVTL